MSKIWLITGSARGLGRNIAEAVLAAGHRLVAGARQTDKLQDLVDRYGDRIVPVVLDVTDAKAAQAAVDKAVAAFGRLDVLVNNAGFAHAAPFEQISDDDFRAQIDTNFYGVVNLTRAALPVMRKQRAGHIIQISSVGGRMGSPGLSAYQSAKWAVGGFTEVLAKEVAPIGIKVTSVEPGGMRTDWGSIARGTTPQIWPDYEPSVGMFSKRLAEYQLPVRHHRHVRLPEGFVLLLPVVVDRQAGSTSLPPLELARDGGERDRGLGVFEPG